MNPQSIGLGREAEQRAGADQTIAERIAQAEVHRRTEIGRRGGNAGDGAARCGSECAADDADPRSVAHGDAAFEIGIDIGCDAARRGYALGGRVVCSVRR